VKAAVPVVGVILAGGLGRRMGRGDKPLLSIGGRSMLDRVIERLRPQVGRIVLNANGDPARFEMHGLPVVADTIGNFAGPLAGLHAGMRWAERNAPEARFIVSVAADTPFFPLDLVERLSACCPNDEDIIVLAASCVGAHPVFGLWPIALVGDLEEFLHAGETGKILAFADRHDRVNVPFDDIVLPSREKVDPFFNVNTPADARRAEEIAAALQRVDA
jgi:molybdopterin-guanine dinucleotide biosynthesis protein A